MQTANKNPDLWEKKDSVTLTHKEHSFIIDAANAHYGYRGDLLWVKEKFTPLPFDMINDRTGLHFSYFADCGAESLAIAKEYGFKWKSSFHMPKEAARLWLMVEDIRVEQVQDISEKDAMTEGVDYHWYDKESNIKIQSAKSIFKELWISINGEDSWNANPWVWVIQYRVLSKTGRPSLEVIEKNYLEVTQKEVVNG